ncbi:hypothetical protein DFJ74DRAFT_674930 [Hyaloraphidium curvatum]|nr:hypothetical protein DFJ74DRAFT_674930 [Hyaloraphidium curvatum]
MDASRSRATLPAGSQRRRRRPALAAGLCLCALGTLLAPASGNPTNAGTLCSAAQLPAVAAAHGGVSAGSGGFSLTVVEMLPDWPGYWNISLSGTSPFKGVLVYASDGSGYAGAFTELPDSLSVKDDCGATSDSVVQHNSPDDKTGFSLSWDGGDAPPADGTKVQIYAIVLQSNRVWYNLPAVEFTYAPGASPTLTPGAETATTAAPEPTATVNPDEAASTTTRAAATTRPTTRAGSSTSRRTSSSTRRTTGTQPAVKPTAAVPDALKNLAGIAVKLSPLQMERRRRREERRKEREGRESKWKWLRS